MSVEISYEIEAVEPRNNTAVIRCWTADTVDEPQRFNLNIPIPAPTAEALKQYILASCPRNHYERLEALKTVTDMSPLLALVGVTDSGVYEPPPPNTPAPIATIPVRTV